jgi:hypothetical protein
MGHRMLVALILEGKFSGDADAVWAELKRENGSQLANAPKDLPSPRGKVLPMSEIFQRPIYGE